MKAHPILFNGDMVRALLAGRKTQTRRVLATQPSDRWHFGTASKRGIILGAITSSHPKKGRFGAFIRREIWANAGKFEHDVITCPFGKPGDLLWVREAFGYEIRNVGGTPHEQITFRASNSDAAHCYDCNGMEQPMKWKPSLHMPRHASRLTLRITDVRVERLQEISEEDAKAEGVSCGESLGGCANYWHSDHGEKFPMAINAFSDLWQSINGPESWSANPWVWVIEFEVIQANVDTVLKQEAA